MKSKLKKMGIIVIVLIIAFFYWLYHASIADPGYATYLIGVTPEVVSTYDLTNGNYDEELIRLDEYAELSDIVYRRPEKEKIDTFLNWEKLPISIDDFQSNLPGKSNLYFEAWGLNEESDETIVAIVLRGTEFSNLDDWGANFRWFIKGVNKTTFDHYDHLGEIDSAMIDAIKNHYSSGDKKLKIVSTGHSLGGGLAQYMAYSIPEINFVYAFDPSPVTGYYDVKPRKRRVENKKDAKIYRIYESGEGLSFARKFMTILYPAPLFKTKDPAIIRIRFDFKTGKGSVGQHSMEDLAKSLRKGKKEKL